uniref:Uncharacterized protein n=1 Tax=Amphimedon queenslandica TaxID=400682 RepID=A0A1X7VR44_AMPQE
LVPSTSSHLAPPTTIQDTPLLRIPLTQFVPVHSCSYQ